MTMSSEPSLASRSARRSAHGSAKRRASMVVLSTDFYIGAASGLAVGVVAAWSEPVRANETAIFLAASALGAGFASVALAALAIIATFLDDHYRRVLREVEGGVEEALWPYKSLAAVSRGRSLWLEESSGCTIARTRGTSATGGSRR